MSMYTIYFKCEDEFTALKCFNRSHEINKSWYGYKHIMTAFTSRNIEIMSNNSIYILKEILYI